MNKITASPWLAALAASLFSAGAIFAADAGAEVLGNADIVELYRARVSESTIIAKINSTPSRFDLSTTSIIALQTNGVSDMVINAMMTAAARTPAPPRLDETRYRTELANIVSDTASAKLDALAWLQTNRALVQPLLRQDLADRRPDTRRAAVIALGHLRDTESLSAMRTLIADPSADVRRAAAEVLAGMNDTQAIAAAETALSRSPTPLDGYVRLIGHVKLTRAAGALGQILSANGDATARAAAAWALGEIGRPGLDGRPALEKALDSDPDPMVRREAASALATYHDLRTARLLEDACRKDYEVRSVTLSALADYPEAVEFLVGVMNLGADQIAVNELETARASLGRLTGQDFGLDGGRWAQWFAANRSRYPSTADSGTPAVTASAPAPASPLPTPPPKPQVDIEAWSIVADASEIPMAPQVEAMTPSFSGLPGVPSLPVASAGAGPSAEASKPLNYTPVPNPKNLPAAPSPRDFEAMTPDLTGIMGSAVPATPTSVPATDLATGALEEPDTASSGPKFQSWSSDPKRVRTDADTDDDDEEYAGRSGGGGGMSPSGTEDFSDLFGPSSGMASAPRQPTPRVVSPLPADEPSSGSQEMRGIALMLPGMENMMDTPTPQPAEAPMSTGLGGETSAMSLTPPSAGGASTTFTAPPSFLSGEDDDVFGAATSPTAGVPATAGDGSSMFESLGASDSRTENWEDSLPGFDSGASSTASATTYVDPFADAAPPATPTIPAATTASVLPTEPTVTIYPADAGTSASTGTDGAPMLLLGVGGAPAAPATSVGDSTGSSAPSLDTGGMDAATGIAVTEGTGAATSTGDSSFLPVHDQEARFESVGGEAFTATGELAESPASVTATTTGEIPAAPSDETAAIIGDSSGSSLFVEPAPGQEVVGEVLISPEMYGSYPAASPSRSDTQPYVFEGEAAPPIQAEVPVSPTPEPVVVAPAPAPEPAPVVQDTRSRAEIYFEATRSGQAYIPQEMYPPTPPAPEGGSAESTPEYPSTADYFADPSAPRPPVRPEGTVTAPRGKEQPPMLGEGLFTK